MSRQQPRRGAYLLAGILLVSLLVFITDAAGTSDNSPAPPDDASLSSLEYEKLNTGEYMFTRFGQGLRPGETRSEKITYYSGEDFRILDPTNPGDCDYEDVLMVIRSQYIQLEGSSLLSLDGWIERRTGYLPLLLTVNFAGVPPSALMTTRLLVGGHIHDVLQLGATG